MVKEIPLSQEKVTLVDDDDYEHLNQWQWSFSKGYARCGIYRNGKRRMIAMHRIIMKAPIGMHVHHINDNGLDNRRLNLQLCTREEHQRTRRKQNGFSSRWKGVSWHKIKGKWQAQIKIYGKSYYLGYFDDEIDAAGAYNQAALRFFGEFAWLNAV